MPGWKRRNRTASALLGAWALVGAPSGPAAVDEREGPSGPSEAFLAFLGQWGNPADEGLDPVAFEGPGWRLLDNEAERQDETD